MIQFVCKIITFCLAVGVAESLVRLTYIIATNAERAQKFDQISYAKFNKALWEAKPRTKLTK